MKKSIAKILRSAAEEKGEDLAHAKRLYKKFKRAWKINNKKQKLIA